MPAGDDLHADREQHVHWGIQHAKKDQTGIHGGLGDIKRVEEPLMAQKHRQQIEHRAGLGNPEQHILHNVPLFIMTNLMRHH